MATNGQLPKSDLAPIFGGGYLRKDAAAAWNAMAAEILQKEGVAIRVNGPDSAYRTYARQVYWRNYWCGQGKCGNAAVPGNSNHGWGIAVDVPEYVRVLIVKYGGKYGWDRGCSDAPWESWHHKWCGGWHGKNPGADGRYEPKYPTLKKGDQGGAVKRAQKHLRRWNLGLTRPATDGDFGQTTKRAVRDFQVVRGLKADGVIGAKTWRALRQKDRFLDSERTHINRIRLMRHDGVSDLERPKIGRLQRLCAERAVAIQAEARRKGWKEENRRGRFTTLRRIAGEERFKKAKEQT